MPEEKKNQPTDAVDKGAAQTVAKDLYGAAKNRRQGGGRDGGRGQRGGSRRDDRPKDDLEQRILEIARVTRVMAGGKRMNFRACVALGDKKGNVGIGLGKGADVTMAVNKAVNHAKKKMINVPTVKDTIPHAIFHKMGAAKIMLKPAKTGRGVIAGGVTRIILELAGVKNVTSKTLGSKSKINNARCTIDALAQLRKKEPSGAGKEARRESGQEVKEDKKEVADKN
ncbi:TPA: 30S ribosomal protein S5 [Candidatus Falkowbacteria bacterium]|jgi:small subunit ribosomal protein S5|nr:MAG: 30S ribosomal protein S5 [Candidatus Falkowbacteria bacterium GW2011_GWF2_43_32]HBA36986.1 30S ribosomal protein S5 [Candidatus Falkowbacteria bacterium]